MPTPDDVRPDPVQIAQVALDFALAFEADPAAHHHNFRWIKSGPYRGESTNFWSYGPDIPKTDGLLLPICSIWHTDFDGWAYCFRGQDIEYPRCDTLEEIKVIVEDKITEQWGEDANTPKL